MEEPRIEDKEQELRRLGEQNMDWELGRVQKLCANALVVLAASPGETRNNKLGGSPKREEDKETEANWREGKQEEKGAELNSKQGEPAFQGSTIPWVEKLRQPVDYLATLS